MAIINSGTNGASASLNYSIVIHQSHEGAPTRIVVPQSISFNDLFQHLFQNGNGTPDLKHSLIPDQYRAFHIIGTEFRGLITQVLPLVVFKETNMLLLGQDQSLINDALSLASE